ncbi:mechanosensitive ion channel protein MscS [Roseobacter denitrificans]|nr:mechanosensitive ion channel [Roseobacter denitrificans]AVL51550.1 mechanosensitive ion channel protein MscS [Roseobacter denitrificans]SFG36412.1 Small-conductance mechanosensitive channel [Roseobacter denitrificans OCh 114]
MSWEEMLRTVEQRVLAYWDGLIAAVPKLGAAIIVLLVTWVVVALVRAFIAKVGSKTRMRQNLIDVLSMLASTGLWLMGMLVALAIVFPTITPGKALTTLGLGSVAIGFAFKDTFENFLAGILILLREPFAINDYVECGDIEGQIEEITIRDTHVRQTDGQLVVVPNHMLFQNPVTVLTNRDFRRTTIICGVAYGENVDDARKVIETAVRRVDTVRDDVRDVQVFAQEFGASSINFEVTWWTGSKPLDIRTSRDQVVAGVKAALDEAGIEIPFPYRTLTFNEPLPVREQGSKLEEAA